MADLSKLIYAIEVHDPKGIRHYFENGGRPDDVYDSAPLFTTMVEMYTRTPRFKECVQAFIQAGLRFAEPSLLCVFVDDAIGLRQLLLDNADLVKATFSLFRNTYTPLTGATLLHFCAEYNSVDCGRLLLEWGAAIDAPAGIDEFGFGGHTPIFHTVNQNSNNSKEMMQLLIEKGADLHRTVKGIIWGQGYPWETWIPAVNPISYALMGLLPQMHRDEKTIAQTLSRLVKSAYGIDYQPVNIPCAYLKS